MKVISDQELHYTVFIEPSEDGGFVASVPMLPGCITQGDTIDDALVQSKEAIAGYLAVLREDGDPIPLERRGRVISEVAVKA